MLGDKGSGADEDRGEGTDAAGRDASSDSGRDAARDSGRDAARDSGRDSGRDAARDLAGRRDQPRLDAGYVDTRPDQSDLRQTDAGGLGDGPAADSSILPSPWELVYRGSAGAGLNAISGFGADVIAVGNNASVVHGETATGQFGKRNLQAGIAANLLGVTAYAAGFAAVGAALDTAGGMLVNGDWGGYVLSEVVRAGREMRASWNDGTNLVFSQGPALFLATTRSPTGLSRMTSPPCTEDVSSLTGFALNGLFAICGGSRLFGYDGASWSEIQAPTGSVSLFQGAWQAPSGLLYLSTTTAEAWRYSPSSAAWSFVSLQTNNISLWGLHGNGQGLVYGGGANYTLAEISAAKTHLVPFTLAQVVPDAFMALWVADDGRVYLAGKDSGHIYRYTPP